MSHRWFGLALLVALLAVVLAAPAVGMAKNKPKPKDADTVFWNGFVYTVDPCQTEAQALAIRGGKIVYVGSDKKVKKYIGPCTEVVDLQGRMVLPGFSDAHAHISSALDMLYKVQLWGLGSLEAYLAAIGDFANANPDLTVITGNGWSEAAFPGIGPRKEPLDGIVPDRPVVLRSDGYHSVWVNSAALDAVGITGETANPENGVIERVPGTVGTPGNTYGEPSGCLRETAADLMNPILPEYTVDQCCNGLRWFQETIAGPRGLTLIHDPLLVPGSTAIAAYEKMAQSGELTMRVRASLEVVPERPLAEQIDAAVAERAKHTTSLFQTNAAKIFEDGVIEGHTGYLLEDYADTPGYRGYPIWEQDALNAACAAADAECLQIHTHGIGDAATKALVDAFAYTNDVNGWRDRRPGVTHLQLVAPDDFQRFADLGVTALPQPYWHLKDDYYFNAQVPYLGQTRADLEYPMKSFFDVGANVASASDWPVTPDPNPLEGIQIGVMRWYPRSQMGGFPVPGDPLWPEQRVTVQQMIESYTINGAYFNYLEGVTGSLKVGKSADMVVLDRNILTCAPEDIGWDNKVLLTLFRGKEVFRDASF